MLARMVSISGPLDPPTTASQSAGITGMSQHAWPKILNLVFNEEIGQQPPGNVCELRESLM